MKRQELLKVNQNINNFFIDHRDCLKNKATSCTVEEYIEFFNEINKDKLPCQFRHHYNYKPTIIRKYRDNIAFAFQPSEIKNGFISIVLQFSKELHMIAQVGVDVRKDGTNIIGVNPLFVTYGGMDPIIEWTIDNEDNINDEVYLDEQEFKGFGM